MFRIYNSTTQRYLARIICTLLLLPASAAFAADGSEIAAPVLKWQHGGCYLVVRDWLVFVACGG